jgi:hypothetical protein
MQSNAHYISASVGSKGDPFINIVIKNMTIGIATDASGH